MHYLPLSLQGQCPERPWRYHETPRQCHRRPWQCHAMGSAINGHMAVPMTTAHHHGTVVPWVYHGENRVNCFLCEFAATGFWPNGCRHTALLPQRGCNGWTKGRSKKKNEERVDISHAAHRAGKPVWERAFRDACMLRHEWGSAPEIFLKALHSRRSTSSPRVMAFTKTWTLVLISDPVAHCKCIKNRLVLR